MPGKTMFSKQKNTIVENWGILTTILAAVILLVVLVPVTSENYQYKVTDHDDYDGKISTTVTYEANVTERYSLAGIVTSHAVETTTASIVLECKTEAATLVLGRTLYRAPDKFYDVHRCQPGEKVSIAAQARSIYTVQGHNYKFVIGESFADKTRIYMREGEHLVGKQTD